MTPHSFWIICTLTIADCWRKVYKKTRFGSSEPDFRLGYGEIIPHKGSAYAAVEDIAGCDGEILNGMGAFAWDDQQHQHRCQKHTKMSLLLYA